MSKQPTKPSLNESSKRNARRSAEGKTCGLRQAGQSGEYGHDPSIALLVDLTAGRRSAIDLTREEVRRLSALRARIGALLRERGAVEDEVGDECLRSFIEGIKADVVDLHGVRDTRLKPVAATMTEFPVVAARTPTFLRSVHGMLERVGVRKMSDKPGVSLRGADDDFTQAARELMVWLEEQGWDVKGLALRNWEMLRQFLREDYMESFLDQENRGERLGQLIKGRGSAGRVRDRVKERVLERVNSLLGFKTKEMKARIGK